MTVDFEKLIKQWQSVADAAICDYLPSREEVRYLIEVVSTALEELKKDEESRQEMQRLHDAGTFRQLTPFRGEECMLHVSWSGCSDLIHFIRSKWWDWNFIKSQVGNDFSTPGQMTTTIITRIAFAAKMAAGKVLRARRKKK